MKTGGVVGGWRKRQFIPPDGDGPIQIRSDELILVVVRTCPDLLATACNKVYLADRELNLSTCMKGVQRCR